jgi:ABC-type lipoprotein release transport system permease subunit
MHYRLGGYGSRLLMRIVFQITTTDFETFVGIPALLTITVAGACLFPAVRAARLNPVEALRIE